MIEGKKHNFSNINFVLTLLMLLFLCTQDLFSQEKNILDTVLSYKAKNVKLHIALTELGDMVGYNFSYNSDLIASNREEKGKYIDQKLQDILYNIIQDSSLVFKIVAKQIVITKRDQISKLLIFRNNNDINKYVRIQGKILDTESNTPLSFSNVSVKGKSIGSISNEQGDFNISISKSFISDTLVFSYIGYKNLYLPISQLSTTNNLIYLTKDNYNIKEVVIRSYNALEILKEAIKNVRNNYYTDPYQVISFYREMVFKENELAAISEAVLDVYKSPYLGPYSDQVKLLQGRKNEYYSRKDTVSLKLKAGLFTSLYLDVIKNPTYFLREKYFHLYTYYVNKVTKYNDNSVYVIEFKPAVYLEENSFQGKIYIDTDDLSIVAVNFSITPDAIDRMGRELIVKKTFRTRVKAESAKYLVNYRKVGNKYFLNFAQGELSFKVKRKKRLFANDFNTSFEFASNRVDTVNVERFERSETLSKNKIFIDEYYDYDYQFWGDYNYISPEKNLQDALIEIQQKLDKLNLK